MRMRNHLHAELNQAILDFLEHSHGAHTSLEFATNDLTNLRAQFQRLFSSALPSSASGFRDFMNQTDVLGLAKFARFASAKLPPQAERAKWLIGIPPACDLYDAHGDVQDEQRAFSKPSILKPLSLANACLLSCPFVFRSSFSSNTPLASRHGTSQRTSAANRMRQPHQQNADQQDVHLNRTKYFDDMRPGPQLEAAQWQHADLCKNVGEKAVTLHTILLGVGGT
eukprot:1147702-Pelagomonas_calceolata.AAC.1